MSTPPDAGPTRTARPGLMLWSLAASTAAAGCCLLAIWLNPEPLAASAMVAATLCIGIAQWLFHRSRMKTIGRLSRTGVQQAGVQELEEVREELDSAMAQLQRRERALAERLATFHEWMEFPEPIQLGQWDSSSGSPSASVESPSSVDEAKTEANLDRQLFALIDEETEKLFNAIRDKKYSVDGAFQASVARDDAMMLVRRVAQLYQPDASEPLLETSAALILRSASRGSLQLLVVLEQLPLDVKEMSISRIYKHVQTAVAYYGAYQKAKPYFPWASNAMYLGRFALGASPLTLGAWYATGKIGAQLAKVATEQVINHQALQLIQNIVRLIAFEVAQMYRGDFRQRDPNWIYAAELTHLASALPASAKTLSLALGEVGALQLRSEYDRVWFYRCLAAGQAGGDTRKPSLGLQPQERLQIANRLERFVEKLPQRSAEAVAAWRLDAERRLGIKLGAIAYVGGDAAVEQSLRSLGGFLLEVKQRSDNLWFLDLETTDTIGLATETLKGRLAESPPFLFEYPDLAPGSELTQTYFKDLLRLAAALPRRGPEVTMMLEEVAAYLRIEADVLQKLWSDALHAELKRVLGDRLRGLPAAGSAARVLDHLDLEGGETPLDALFWPARILQSQPADAASQQLVLVAVDGALRAWDGESLEPVWEVACAGVEAEQQRGMLGSNCMLRPKEPDVPKLIVEGAAWTRYQRYFEPLLKLL